MHKLLLRQLKKSFKGNIPEDESFQRFISLVSESYEHNDNDRELLDRAMIVSSDELREANKKLTQEAKNKELILKQIIQSISLLTRNKEELEFVKTITSSTDSKNQIQLANYLKNLAEDRNKNEQDLLFQDARMEEAQKLAHFATWTHDYVTNKTEFSANLGDLIQLKKVKSLSLDQYKNIVHTLDKHKIEQELQKLSIDNPLTIIHRVGKVDGRRGFNWVRVSLKYVTKHGQITHLLGVMQNITKQKTDEINLEKQVSEHQNTSTFLDTVIESMPIGVMVMHNDSRTYVKANSVAADIYGFQVDQIIGKTNKELFDEDKAHELNSEDDYVHLNDVIYRNLNELISDKKGNEKMFSSYKVPVKNNDGRVIYILTIKEDVTERRKSEEEVKKAAKIAQEANRAKSSFLSSMSHELRTPLNAIIGFSQLLQNDEQIPAQQRSYVETMYRSGNHLLAMINDVLDISKIESGKFDLVYESFTINEMIKDLSSMFKLTAKEKNLDLQFNLEETFNNYYYSDVKRLQQVLINLISNALKFTNKGFVKITVSKTPILDSSSDQVTFSIQDSGRGIPEKQIQYIFEPFRQVKGFYSEGTGLGLAISSKIAELLNGSITVESKMGVGSTFKFSIPLETAVQIDDISNQEYHPVQGIKGDKKWRVLIVDDVANNRAVVKAFLEAIGFDCLESDNGSDAVMMANLFKPDIIFMDIMMPGIDGATAFKMIKKNPKLEYIKIIALTASGSEKMKKELLEMGFDDYITKPYREKWIIQSLEKHANIEFLHQKKKKVDETLDVSDNGWNSLFNYLTNLDSATKEEWADACELQDFDKLDKISDLIEDVEHKKTLKEYIKKQDYLFFINLSDKLN